MPELLLVRTLDVVGGVLINLVVVSSHNAPHNHCD